MLDIVIPAKNEQESLTELVTRINVSCKKARLKYRIIIVDDNSTDKTNEVAKKLSKKYPITILRRTKNPGKAFALLDGIKKSKASYIAIIDADLQYPPELIPEMFSIAKSKNAIVTANRAKHKTNFLRKLASSANSLYIRKLLGIECDIQSGLKVFRREIADYIQHESVTKWTIDMHLLTLAKRLGYAIESVDCVFEERKKGSSKINLFTDSLEIAKEALKVAKQSKEPLIIKPSKKNSMIGAGVSYLGKKYITHTTLPLSQSAIFTFTKKQKLFIAAVLLALGSGLFLNAWLTSVLFIGALSIIYFLDVLFTFFTLLKSLNKNPEMTFTEDDLSNIQDKNLPLYTILCPLYKESNVLPHFIESIGNLDWPKKKLEVLLLLEENDLETQEAAKKLKMPSYIHTIIVPDSQPKTKPKACNYGLNLAKGKYVVIYDAEDRPDPLQLKKAYLGFERSADSVICLQSKLNYYNQEQNLLTRLFTSEYSLWFDIILPGFQSINTVIPLGGTSNHFKTRELLMLGGWDPFNVTEDCDLGVRLFKQGKKTAIINSTTYEEANSQIRNWIRQRSRWIKGYYQTYLVHMRNPITFFKEFGHQAFIFQLVIGMRTTFMLINPFLWIMTIAYFTLYQYVGLAIESLFPPFIFYMAGIALIAGNFLHIYNYMIGCAKREQWENIKFVYFIPFYWLLSSIAAAMAFYQLITKPYYWEKTHHGLHLPGLKMKKGKEPGDENESKPKSSFLKDYRLTGASFLIAATALNNLFGFLYNAYLGRNLLPSEFGTIALIGSLISIITLPVGALAGTVSYRTAYLIGKFGGTAQKFWSMVRSHALFTSFVVTSIWMALSPFFVMIFDGTTLLPFILSAPIWIMTFAAAVDRGFLISNFKFGVLAFVVSSEAILKYVFAYLFVEYGFHEYVYAAIPLSMLLPFFVAWSVSRKSTSTVDLEHEIAHYFPKKFFITSMIMGLSSVGFLSFDIILAKYFLDPVSAGYYTLLSLVGKMVYFVGQLFSQFAAPIVSRAEGSGKDTFRAYGPLYAISVLGTFFAFLLFGVFGTTTLPLILGDRSIPIFPYVFLYTLAIAIYTVASLLAEYHQIVKHYIFAYTGLLLALVEIVALSLFHSNLLVFVYSILGLSIFYFGLIVSMHFFYEYIVVFCQNVRDLWGLFVFKINGLKPLPNGKLRILIYNWRDTKHIWAGGAEVYVQELAKGFVEKGHTVTIFCGNDGKSRRDEIVDGVQIIRRGGFYTVYVWAFLYYIFRFRRRFDLVIESENGVPFFTPLYSTKPKILVVHHVHQEVFQNHLQFPLSTIAQFVEKVLTPIVYRNQHVVAVSESTKKDIIKNGIAKEENISIVSPGVDISVFKKTRKGKYPTFIYVGRHKPYKNIDIAIKAFAKVQSQISTSKLIIAGDGENTWELKELARNLGLQKSILFTGKVSEEKKIQLLGSSWAAIQPSSFEGWGITVIEGNACGTPVIASDVKGLRDSVVNKKTGLLVPPKNIDAFAKSMLLIAKNAKKRKALSIAAYDWSRECSWEKSVSKFLHVIDERKGVLILNGELATSMEGTYE